MDGGDKRDSEGSGSKEQRPIHFEEAQPLFQTLWRQNSVGHTAVVLDPFILPPSMQRGPVSVRSG